jgi:hypothetical protein
VCACVRAVWSSMISKWYILMYGLDCRFRHLKHWLDWPSGCVSEQPQRRHWPFLVRLLKMVVPTATPTTLGNQNDERIWIIFPPPLVWSGTEFANTEATYWPIVSSLDNDRWWVWSSRYNAWQGKPKYSGKTCPSAALSTNPTWPDPSLNPGCHSWKPATNCSMA